MICYQLGHFIVGAIGYLVNLKTEKNKTARLLVFVSILIGVSILVFMYSTIIARYNASTKVVFIISLGWLVFVLTGYYIFTYRLNKLVKKH